MTAGLELLNPRNLSYFFLSLPPNIYISLYSFLRAALSLFLILTVFILLTITHPPPSSCLLRASCIRGIPEGDFPCFRLSVWPLKNCLLPKTVVQGIQANTCYTVQGLSSKHSRTNSPASAHPSTQYEPCCLYQASSLGMKHSFMSLPDALTPRNENTLKMAITAILIPSLSRSQEL